MIRKKRLSESLCWRFSGVLSLTCINDLWRHDVTSASERLREPYVDRSLIATRLKASFKCAEPLVVDGDACTVFPVGSRETIWTFFVAAAIAFFLSSLPADGDTSPFR